MMLKLENINLTEVHVTFKGNRSVKRLGTASLREQRQEVGLLKTELGDICETN